MLERIARTPAGKKIFILLLPFFVLGSIFCLRPLIFWIGAHMPKCVFFTMTGFYCPGCGNTRSVMSLLQFDILDALRYNITPILLGIASILGYLELLTAVFGRRRHFFSRRYSVNFTLLGLLLVYYVVRNFIPWLMP